MKIQVITNLVDFTTDLSDIVRLFWGAQAAVTDAQEANGVLTHMHSVSGGQWTETCVLTVDAHEDSQVRSFPIPLGVDHLEEKRQLKREIKVCAYELIKRYTCRQLPWGSLTGVRPTRLMYSFMLKEQIDRVRAGQRMHETYDLLPEKVELLEEIIEQQQGLITRDRNIADVYVGIPFCTTRCSYCSFISGEIGDGHLVEPYLYALEKEIDAAAILMNDAGLSLRAIYFGGGTPTSLSAHQLDRLLAKTAIAFPNAREWTVEAGRPDTMDGETLRVLRSYPISRISINPQSMNNATLERIGRAHSADEVIRAFAHSRALGFDDINMDVICGLPGETKSDFAYTLSEVQKLEPESLTVHTLAIKHSSKLHQSNYTAQEDGVHDMVRMGYDMAHAMDMKAYYLYRQKYMAGSHENVGYAKHGHACRYNIDIMEETTSIIALGAGAISKRVREDEKLRIKRAPNVSNIEQYISRVDEMAQRKRRVFMEVNDI